MRCRSPSYTPLKRGREGREHGDRGRRSPNCSRGRNGRRGDPPTSLLVRNIPRDCLSEDLRLRFERYGFVKDVYLPKDYYTREPRGFGFVQYMDPGDAREAQYHMDHQVISGREITVVFAEENRKKPQEMQFKERVRGRSTGYGESVRRQSPYYVRSRSRSPSRGEHPRHLGRHSKHSLSCTPPQRAHDQSSSPVPRTSQRLDQKYSRSASPPSWKDPSGTPKPDRTSSSPLPPHVQDAGGHMSSERSTAMQQGHRDIPGAP